jgi:hypothetical protein
MKLYGYSYIHSDEYNAVYDRPDIFISSEGYLDKENCMNIRKTAKLVVATSMVMNNFFLNIEDLCIQNFDAAYQDIDPDYFLLDSAIYQELSEYGYKKDKLVEMGNAKYDGIYETCKRKVYQPEWEKLKGRKTVLWITTHGVYPYNKNFYTSIDLYARTIFEYFEENDDLGLIFRPNSQLFRDLFRLGIWKEGDVRKIGDYCNRTSNVVFDDSDSYDNAFSVADAIITDEMCGVIYSGLPTMKPICITYRSDSYLRPNKDKVLNNYYSASSNEELVGYLEMINAGKDPMYDLRKAASEKYVKNFDGKNGERIKEFVEEKYFELVQ